MRIAAMFLAMVILPGCETELVNSESPSSNTTDPTNRQAQYVGTAACVSCHNNLAEAHALHGHANALSSIRGQAPNFPVEADRAGLADPPEGFEWSQIAWVIGGYSKGAMFVDLEGNLVTSGAFGVDALWLLDFPANGTTNGFAPFLSEQATPEPFSFDRFFALTTGAMPLDQVNPLRQENRAGVEGTWVFDGVQCEACHGPGSNHFTIGDGGATVDRSAIFVDTSGDDTCNACHSATSQPVSGIIAVEDGFLASRQQYSELSVSGGHSAFSCRTCHDPHHSVALDRANAIRNGCTDCHAEMNMARHDDAVFVRGDYTENVSCESCHMPFATRAASLASESAVASPGRMGDTRTHIFRISTDVRDFSDFASADGTQIALDTNGLAAVTLDYVCLRCHNDSTPGLFSLSVERASEIAPNLHRFGDE